MWEAVGSAPLPIYSVYRKDKRKQSKAALSETSLTAGVFPHPPSVPPTPNATTDLVEPSVDGPPSPGRLRQISKQMRGTMLERSHQHQSYSGPSSLRSFTSADRPAWEQHTSSERISLSRRSSSRSSTASSIPSRDRPDSVQIFGKAIFNRRSKLKRESKSSSGSSVYSGDVDVPTSSTAKDYFIPVVLRRRRATTTNMKEASIDGVSPQQKKIQISGPYNFQHVTHAHRDAALGLQSPTNSSVNTPTRQADGIHHFPNFSSEAINMGGQQDVTTEPHSRLSVARPLFLRSQTSPSQGLATGTQEQPMRIAPPRPPRSPPLEPSTPFPPVPPPRLSSRATMHCGDYEPMEVSPFERPGTGNGFRQPAPFSPPFDYPEPPMAAHGFGFPSDEMKEYFDPRFSHALTTPDDAAWPMTSSGNLSFGNTLAEVPEEEENNCYTTERSRLSITSTSSSLRASQSVPALRQQIAKHRDSNASDTLGRFDMSAAQKALKESMDTRRECLPRESWEDVIDYCYDHEAEADFDYEWARPSLDIRSCTPLVELDQDEVSPYLNTLSCFDVPELSPASQTSNMDQEEVLTPMTAQAPSNFSLPMKEHHQQCGASERRAPHIRTASHASSFKESHGFNLSPSLLIPNDYHEQMLLARTESNMYPEEEAWIDSTYLVETHTVLNPEDLRCQLRASVSSMGTESSNASSSPSSSETCSAERHISTASSTATAYSRFTVNSNDVDEMMLPKSDLHSLIKSALSDAIDSSSDNLSVLGDLPVSREHSRNRSVPLTAVEVGGGVSPKESIRARRQRSRTAGSGTGTPTYGLFPTISVQGTTHV